jgi:hypothetical protein
MSLCEMIQRKLPLAEIALRLKDMRLRETSHVKTKEKKVG